MSGWDAGAVFYSDPIADGNQGTARADATKQFREFVREFRDDQGVFCYR